MIGYGRVRWGVSTTHVQVQARKVSEMEKGLLIAIYRPIVLLPFVRILKS